MFVSFVFPEFHNSGYYISSLRTANKKQTKQDFHGVRWNAFVPRNDPWIHRWPRWKKTIQNASNINGDFMLIFDQGLNANKKVTRMTAASTSNVWPPQNAGFPQIFFGSFARRVTDWERPRKESIAPGALLFVFLSYWWWSKIPRVPNHRLGWC